MFDPSSLLGGMLSGGFGRRRARSSGPGVLGTVATVGGIAAVGGLGYMAYKHFTAQPGAQGAPGWGAGPQGAPGWGAAGAGAPPGVGGWGPPTAGGPGAPPGVGGWGPPPGTAPGGGAGGAIGDFMKGLVGNTGGLQTGGFGAGMPGYEYQTGAASPAAGAAPAGGTPWGAPTGGSPGAWPAPPAATQPVATPPGGASTGAPPGAVPIPPPPVFDASGAIVAAAPAVAGPAAPAATAPAALATGSVAAPTDAEQRAAMLLVRAMVAAANADGTIDAEERQEILGRLEATGLGAEERAALAAELDRPRPVASLAVEVTDPELAKQFYAVSLLAIDVDNAAERMHLQTLPAMLRLSADDVAKIHAELGVPAIA